MMKWRMIALLVLFTLAVSGGVYWNGKKQADRVQAQAQRADRATRANAIAACERGNKLRRATNRRVREVRVLRDAVAEFLGAAAEARGARRNALDQRTAREYLRQQVAVTRLEFKTEDIIDCQEAFPPIVPGDRR